MKSMYKKYYDALVGKEFASKVNNYKSAVSNSKDKLNAAKATIESSQWVEKGIEIIKNSVMPSLKSQGDQFDNGLEALSQAIAKVKELTDQLKELDTLDKKLESLGSKWTYSSDGERTEASVNSHNNEIAETERKISNQESLINSTIAAINGISFSYTSQSSQFSGYMSELKEATKVPPSGVLSYTQGTFYEPGRENRVLGNVATLLDFTCDGVSLGQDGSIVIKKGTTAHLKVKIPDELENVTEIIRTSPDGKKGWSYWVSQEVTPKANKNDQSTWFNGREYDWYITGNEVTDNITLSQTALFKIPGGRLGSYKGMARLRVKIVD